MKRLLIVLFLIPSLCWGLSTLDLEHLKSHVYPSAPKYEFATEYLHLVQQEENILHREYLLEIAKGCSDMARVCQGVIEIIQRKLANE